MQQNTRPHPEWNAPISGPYSRPPNLAVPASSMHHQQHHPLPPHPQQQYNQQYNPQQHQHGLPQNQQPDQRQQPRQQPQQMQRVGIPAVPPSGHTTHQNYPQQQTYPHTHPPMGHRMGPRSAPSFTGGGPPQGQGQGHSLAHPQAGGLPPPPIERINNNMNNGIPAPHLAPINHNAITVSRRQQGNPLLKYIRNVRWQYGDIIPDYVLGQSTAALFLSLRYHLLKPEYVHTRMKELPKSYRLRILLVHVDTEDAVEPLAQVTRAAIGNDFTLFCGFNNAECARYLEILKR